MAEKPVLPADPDFEVPMLPEVPEVVATREGVHKRIQAEMYQEIEAMSFALSLHIEGYTYID